MDGKGTMLGSCTTSVALNKLSDFSRTCFPPLQTIPTLLSELACVLKTKFVLSLAFVRGDGLLGFTVHVASSKTMLIVENGTKEPTTFAQSL